MYLKKIEIENVGPINSKLEINLPFFKETNDKPTLPKPLIFVGKNGSGKSILLSYILDSLINFKRNFYDDAEIPKDKLYKILSKTYISIGKDYSFANLGFTSNEQNFFLKEVLTRLNIELFKERYNKDNSNEIFQNVVTDERFIESGFFQKHSDKNTPNLKSEIDTSCFLFFPANRFEQPAWLNEQAFETTEILQLRSLINLSNRNIIINNQSKEFEKWLLSVLLDLEIYERPHNITGPNTLILDYVNNFLKIILNNPYMRFGSNRRNNNARLSIGADIKDKGYIEYSPSGLHLSTGESSLIMMFTSILKDYDLIKNANFATLENIKGIVIIDEIDLHLHPDLQGNILPKLIKLFPKIQFIITTHSPLFLLGMEKEFGSDFEILELPTGEKIKAEDFNEFKTAYEFYEDTKTFENYIRQFKENKSPIIFVEDEFHQKVLGKLIQKFKINMNVQIVGCCSNVENICEYFKADDTKYFLTDGDNKGNKFKQVKNFIHLSKYCLENYFFNPEILQIVLSADETIIKEKIFEIISKLPLGNITAPFIDLAQDKDPALFRVIFTRFDCSKIIDDFLESFNITKDKFICNYVDTAYKKDEYKKIFSEITDILSPSNVVDIKTKRKKHSNV